VVNPTAKFAGAAGVTVIEDNVLVGVVVVVVVVLDVDVDEQDVITVINTIIIPIVRKLIKNLVCFLFKVFPLSSIFQFVCKAQ
jgi:hypothetical protein